ncbi:MAG: serine hydrolase [Acetobacteraceae bacterium]|nr:serine hydrolase [Acetobacteraceae bacterium]
MHRRTLAFLAASTLAGSLRPGVLRAADDSGDQLQGAGGDLGAALQGFLALPGTMSCLIHAGQGGSLGRIAHRPKLVLFTASAYKTFVLGQYLRDVEAGLLSEDEQLAIDDSVRNVGSPVFIDLAGTIQARSVLDAMIAYSDNIATDLATRTVGADRVRALIAEAGLTSIRIPDTTRLFASYVIGAPAGVDLGWPGIMQAYQNPPGPIRPLLNDVITLAGNARDFVSWYEQALAGAFFTKPETLIEFKRIQAESVQIPLTVPPDTPAYAKGGEVPSFYGSNAKSFAGQMVVGSGKERTPVTFCFVVNWNGPAEEFPAVEAAFFAAIKSILTIIKQALQ